MFRNRATLFSRTQNFSERGFASCAEPYSAAFTDQVYSPAYQQAGGVIKIRDTLPLVDQERERKPVFLYEPGVFFGALRVHAEYQSVFRRQAAPAVAELA
jgi:hypothetical protein